MGKSNHFSDSRSRKMSKWLKRFQVIDFTTITLFSCLLFKGVGPHNVSGTERSYESEDTECRVFQTKERRRDKTS